MNKNHLQRGNIHLNLAHLLPFNSSPASLSGISSDHRSVTFAAFLLLSPEVSLLASASSLTEYPAALEPIRALETSLIPIPKSDFDIGHHLHLSKPFSLSQLNSPSDDFDSIRPCRNYQQLPREGIDKQSGERRMPKIEGR
jgi:hypothetical protein